MKRYQIDKYNIVNTLINTNIKLTTLREHEKIMNTEEYRSIVRALNYAAMLTRPDITTAVGMVARYIQLESELSIYIKKLDHKILIITVYMDDL